MAGENLHRPCVLLLLVTEQRPLGGEQFATIGANKPVHVGVNIPGGGVTNSCYAECHTVTYSLIYPISQRTIEN